MILKICLLSLALCGAFEYRDPGPWQPFPFITAIADPELPGGTNPSIIYSVPHLSSAGEYHSSIPDLRGESCEAGGEVNPFLAGRLGFSRYGIGEYREYILSPALCVRGGRWISAGISFDCCRLDVHGDEGDAAEMSYQGSAGCTVRPFPWLALAGVGTRLVSPFRREERCRGSAEYGYGCAASPVEGVTLAVNRSETGPGAMTTMDVRCALLDCWSVSIGYCVETGESSTGICLAWKRFLVAYRFRYHPGLGSTHGLGLTACLKPPVFKSMVHDVRHTDPSARKDICTISDDEIRHIDVLTPDEAERLVRYRRDVGPLSVDSLYQMGLSRQAVIRLMDMYFGFYDEREDAPSRDGYRRRVSSPVKARQSVFRKLVELGLPPLRALELVQMSGYADPQELDVRLRAIGLEDDRRQRALALCVSLHQ